VGRGVVGSARAGRGGCRARSRAYGAEAYGAVDVGYKHDRPTKVTISLMG
jgi:hypothetical protein